MINQKKEILQLQKQYYKQAIEYFGSRNGLAEAINVDNHILVWISKGNIMKPEVALKFDFKFAWFKAERIRPDVFTPEMMEAQRKYWKSKGWHYKHHLVD